MTFELPMPEEHKNKIDNKYSEALCEALDMVLRGNKDISEATAEEMQNIISITCICIMKYYGDTVFDEKQIRDYVKDKIIADINDSNNDEDDDRKIDVAPIRNIDNF